MARRSKRHPVDYNDHQWRALLSFALQRADSFECAVPYPFIAHNLARTPLWPRALNAFRGQLIDRYVSFVRWESCLSYPTQFVRFRLQPELIEYIRAIGPLDNWQWDRQAPEDPAFYAADELLLATSSADGRIAVFVADDEIASLEALGVRLVEPLGVTAEPWPTP